MSRERCPQVRGMSRERYLELKYFCRQYRQRRAEIGPVVEKAARETAGDVMAQFILRHVTAGESFERMRPPCGKNYFYAARRRFFERLDADLKKEREKGDAGK